MRRRCPIVSHLLFADFTGSKGQYCANFMQLASAFGEASGLSINIQKSSLFFSPNMPMEKWQEIRAVLRMGDMDTKAKYLGLPTLWEGSKKELMSFIRDNIMRKIRGWKGSQTKQVGKEVLIKSVLQGISMYPLMCFKIPAFVISKFWWGKGNGDRSIHLGAWKKMSIPRLCGFQFCPPCETSLAYDQEPQLLLG